jgi:hypothetical protein
MPKISRNFAALQTLPSFLSALSHWQSKAVAFACALLLVGVSAQAQQRTRISGVVSDALNGDALPFVNVVFKGSTIGTVTDTLGRFQLETNRKFDSLSVSFTGYHTTTLPVRHGITQTVDIPLQPRAYQLGEVRVRPGENPAWKILRKVIENKPITSPSHLDAYEYEAYHRVQFDLNHFTDKAKKNILLRPFDYIWENADTTADGVRYLPMLLSENSEKHYWRKQPEAKKREVSGTRTYKFFKAPRIMEFVEDMHVDPDVYKNNLVILDRTFPSPINDNFRLYYRYMLNDSVRTHNGHRCYLIYYRPQGEADVAFTGQMLIDSASYAVVQMDLEFSIAANINFVRNYWIQQDFSWEQNKQWFLTKSQVIADFTVLENAKDLTGFFGRKTTTVRDIKLNAPRPDDFYKTAGPVVFSDSATARSEEFWQQARPDSFSLEEKNLVGMVNRMSSDPRWKRTEAILRAIAENWLPLGPVELGDILTFYTYNKYEGHRVKLGLRTSDKFSKTIQLGGYLAYGIGDRKLKSYLDIDFRPEQKHGKHTAFGLNYRNDMVQPGRHPTVQPLDNIINSFIKLSGSSLWLMQERASAYAERQWMLGFTTQIEAFSEGLTHLGTGFLKPEQTLGDARQTVHHSGFSLTMRWSHGLGVLPGGYEEGIAGIFPPEKPVVSFNITSGFKGYMDGQFTYQHLRLKVEHRLRLNRLGQLNILAEGGWIFGDVPWPLLHHPSANPLIFNNSNSFNLLNFMEFASDRYVALHLEHHFDGLLFNIIPWFNKLKLREVVFARAYYGGNSTTNPSDTYMPPLGTATTKTPYVEVGFGIENILKVASINFTWRVTNLDHPDVLGFIVKPGYIIRF